MLNTICSWEGKAPAPPSDFLRKEWFPLEKPNWEQHKKSGSIAVTWLGHASCFVTMPSGCSVLTDPVFSHRASPVQWAGPARYVPVPCRTQEIPTPHIILISHDHYDHLDVQSITDLESQAKTNGKHLPVYAVGLGLKSWFLDTFKGTITEDRVFEYDWWQKHSLPNGITIEFVPAQHWGSRNHFDKLTRLWGGFVVTDSGRKFYFAGDTGFNEELFTEIGNRHGPIDLAAIPIGAYEPRWFMSPQHISPEEAYQVHTLINSKHSFGIHWGTFILTDEPLIEPKQIIEAEVAKSDNPSPFITLKHGQTISL